MAIDRYATVGVGVDRDRGVRNYDTTIFPTIPILDSDVYIVTRDGDRFDTIANRFYQDSTLWWVIASANGLLGSLFIPPGTRLRIPTDVQFVLSYINEINDSR